MECKNCHHHFEGNFCNQCGQNAKVQRINRNYLVSSMMDNVFQINHGLLYTIKSLLLNPGESLNNFFKGERKKFYKPFAFLLITSTILLLSTTILGNDTYFDAALSGFGEGLMDNTDWKDSTTTSSNFLTSLLNFLTQNQVVLFLAFVPIFSLSSYLAYKRDKFNFYEHIILNLYITGVQLLIYSFASFIDNQDSLLTLIPFAIGFIYNIYVYNQVFNHLSWLNRNLKLFFTYILFFLFHTILAAIFVGIFIFAYR